MEAQIWIVVDYIGMQMNVGARFQVNTVLHCREELNQKLMMLQSTAGYIGMIPNIGQMNDPYPQILSHIFNTFLFHG